MDSPPGLISDFIQWEEIVVVPSFHSRLQFALEVRKAFLTFQPEVVCVELPEILADSIIEAVQHLPYISVVAYKSESMADFKYIPIDPGDSIIETIRLALETDTPVEFIDVPLEVYAPNFERLPDDFAVSKVGLSKFVQEITGSGSFERVHQPGNEAEKKSWDEINRRRERHMAHRLHEVRAKYKANRILLTIGMAHWPSLQKHLEGGNTDAVRATMGISFEQAIYNVHPDSFVHLLQEVPFVTFRYETTRADAMNRLRPSDAMDALFSVDKYAILREIFMDAKRNYAEKYGEILSPQTLTTLFQYGRNLALTRGRLVPSFFDLIVAAKNVVDDDYAGEVLDIASSYPPVDPKPQFPFIQFTLPGSNPDQQKISLRRHLPVEDERGGSIKIRRRPKEPFQGAWKKAWEEELKWNQVSYPPEDRRFEAILAFLKHKTLRLFKAKRVRVHEFTSSMMDGLDIKETIRNLYRNAIFVREEIPFRGEIGPIVVIFDEDEKRRRYSYELSWIAEHGQESDLALYCTDPAENLIGPKIARVELGGFCSVFPPLVWNQKLYFDPWDPSWLFEREGDYMENLTDKRHERLLYGAIINATPEQRYILYVANKSPRQIFMQLARQKGGHEIIYIPLDQFSADVAQKLRVLHILQGRKTRDIAHKFIFL